MVVKHTIRNQRLIHVPIETRGVVADWNTASDELIVHSSTQMPHFLRTFLAIVCGVSEAKVRAIAPEVGGGFGSKLNAYAEEFIAAAASRKVGAPVKWIEERSEAMLATCHGRAQDATMELAATKDGKVLAMRAHYVQDYGSYLQMLTPLDLAAHAVHGRRRVRHPAGRRHCHERLHEHRADRRATRRRKARGHPRHRADDGHPGARARA